MRVRLWGATLVVLAGLSVVLAVLGALAGNAATATSRWPGLLDVLRRDPWPWTGVLAGLAVLATSAAMRMQLRPAAGRDDPPPPTPVGVPEWFVDRAQTRAIAAAVCGSDRAVGITTSLWGAGGFGKTTLANAVCARRRVLRRFRSRIYPVTIGRDVRSRAAIAAKVAEVTRFITGDTTEFDDPDLAGAHLGRLLDQRGRTLLVLDDVWEADQLAPFLRGGRRCVRLVTTRNAALLPSDAQGIRVDQMSHDQAKAVLTWNLPPLPTSLAEGLLRATGRWALLLRLTNRLIAEQCAAGADPTVVSERVLDQLRRSGPAAVDDSSASWDLDDPRLRNRAVKASVEAATTLLPPGGQERFAELGIFAENESIPIPLIALLWQIAGLSEEQTRSLCRDLERLSLLTLDPQDGGTVSLHDVIRSYLRGELGTAGLTRLNGLFIDAVTATLADALPLVPAAPEPGHAWWQTQHGYLLDHLIDHLLAAGRISRAEAVAGDLRWVETRLAQRGPSGPWSDLISVNTPYTDPLARSLAQTAHLLFTPIGPTHVLNGALHTRLDHDPHWAPQIAARRNTPTQRPYLVAEWPLPDASTALQRTLIGNNGWVDAVAIGPDGTWLATGGEDGIVRIWDRASGSCMATLANGSDSVWSVAVSSDGTWLATTSSDYRIRIWDRASGECIATLLDPLGSGVSVAFGPDNTWLTTVNNVGIVRIWDRASGECTAILRNPDPLGNTVAVSPDGTWLATARIDGLVRLWDRSPVTCTATLVGHTGSVESVAIAPDGTWLATTGVDGRVRFWDQESGECTADLMGHTGSVESVAIAPDGTWLATTGVDGTVRIWDRATATCTAILTGHTGSARSVAIAPDGTWLATTGMDGTVRIWGREATAPASLRHRHTDSVVSVAISPDGTWFATVGEDGRARIWDRASGEYTTPFTHSVVSVAISPDGTGFATVGEDGGVRIWDRASGESTATFDHSVVSVAISPDGTWIAATGKDGRVRIWDRATGERTATLARYTRSVLSAAVSPDGTWIVTVGEFWTVRIWDRASGKCTANLAGHTGPVRAVAISPDGAWLATGGDDGTVRIWDRASGRRTANLAGHTGPVRAVAISPDGAWLAIASDDGSVWIWSIAAHRTVAGSQADGALVSCAWGTGNELALGGVRGLYLFSLLT
ncbi:NB-ARC domain-containing protein [Streptomyces anulatus]|uniref:NB-ARC domain-containing protein n=1 Tax=Streptomyces anulatus TaxID=1892 RepID=UPI0036B2CD24